MLFVSTIGCGLGIRMLPIDDLYGFRPVSAIINTPGETYTIPPVWCRIPPVCVVFSVHTSIRRFGTPEQPTRSVTQLAMATNRTKRRTVDLSKSISHNNKRDERVPFASRQALSVLREQPHFWGLSQLFADLAQIGGVDRWCR